LSANETRPLLTPAVRATSVIVGFRWAMSPPH
jgi:hypothetical protein